MTNVNVWLPYVKRNIYCVIWIVIGPISRAFICNAYTYNWCQKFLYHTKLLYPRIRRSLFNIIAESGAKIRLFGGACIYVATLYKCTKTHLLRMTWLFVLSVQLESVGSLDNQEMMTVYIMEVSTTYEWQCIVLYIVESGNRCTKNATRGIF